MGLMSESWSAPVVDVVGMLRLGSPIAWIVGFYRYWRVSGWMGCCVVYVSGWKWTGKGQGYRQKRAAIRRIHKSIMERRWGG